MWTLWVGSEQGKCYDGSSSPHDNTHPPCGPVKCQIPALEQIWQQNPGPDPSSSSCFSAVFGMNILLMEPPWSLCYSSSKERNLNNQLSTRPVLVRPRTPRWSCFAAKVVYTFKCLLRVFQANFVLSQAPVPHHSDSTHTSEAQEYALM